MKHPMEQAISNNQSLIANQIIEVIENGKGTFHQHPTGVKLRIDLDHSSHFKSPEPSLKDDRFPFDVCVVGGCGHVGLPLAITIANRKLQGQRVRHQ